MVFYALFGTFALDNTEMLCPSAIKKKTRKTLTSVCVGLTVLTPAGDKTSLRVPYQSGYFGPAVRLLRTSSSVTSD